MKTLLGIDLKALTTSIESRVSIKLPREIVEVYLDRDNDLLFIRFREPKRLETGEQLPLKTIAILFRDEDTDEITALEIIGASELLKELGISSTIS